MQPLGRPRSSLCGTIESIEHYGRVLAVSLPAFTRAQTGGTTDSARLVAVTPCGLGWKKHGVTRVDSINISKLWIRLDDALDLDP
jgi:hypothetical protein